MLLSRAAEVALKALPHFDPRGPEAPGREARVLSLACGEPAPFLGKVLQKLARAGLLRSKRGRTGGFVLGRPASEISLADIVLAVEGADDLNKVLGLPEGPVEVLLGPARDELAARFRDTTLARLRREAAHA
ncbi:MAG: Rrf2 family transcriptional regulator [Holophagales bacterium]|nr:Rrf2 family transcriptional regulator [Holophagales bacterium]